MSSFQAALTAVKQQAQEIQTEFLKSREFYKNELTKAFERRRAVEIKLDDARAEQDCFANLLRSSVPEKESVNKMLSAAKRRPDNIDELERKAIELKAENAQLKHDATIARQEIEVLQRDVEPMRGRSLSGVLSGAAETVYATENPEKLKELRDAWDRYALEVGVVAPRQGKFQA